MNRKASLTLITLLVALALSFSQGFAAGPSAKKTPVPNNQPPTQPGQPDKGKPGSDEKPGGGQKDKEDKPTKPEKSSPPGQDKKDDKGNKPDNGKAPQDGTPKNNNPKDEMPKDGKPKDDNAPKEKTVHLRGEVTGVGEGSLTLSLGKNITVTLLLDGADIHNPKDGSFSGWSAGMQVTVKAIPQPDPNTFKAMTINLIPAAPTHFHHVGALQAYTRSASGSGSLTVNGQVFKITPETVILPKCAQLTADAVVTVVCGGQMGPGGEVTAKAVVVHQGKQNK